MLFVIIQLPARPFNPFEALFDDVFDVYETAKKQSRINNTSYISCFNNAESAQTHINELAAQCLRFLVLEMLVEHRYQIAMRQAEFTQSLQRANFHYGYSSTPIQSNGNPAPVLSEAKQFLSHIPSYDAKKISAAKDLITEKGEDQFPDALKDPITYESLLDPVEINNRVYNRETVKSLIDEDGFFKDPITRELVDSHTAKPADYIFNAIHAHADVLASKRPSFMDEEVHRTSNCRTLIDLFEAWQAALAQPSSHFGH